MNTLDTSSISGLLKQFEGGDIENIAQKLNISTDQVKNAISQAVPQLKAAMSQTNGKEAAQNVIEKMKQVGSQGMEGVKDTISSAVGKSSDSSNASCSEKSGLLKEALGDKMTAITQSVSKSTGIAEDKINSLLCMISPKLMMSHIDQIKSDTMQKVTDATESVKEHASTSKSSITEKLHDMLDVDGDGKLGMSDIVKAGSSLLGRNKDHDSSANQRT